MRPAGCGIILLAILSACAGAPERPATEEPAINATTHETSRQDLADLVFDVDGKPYAVSAPAGFCNLLRPDRPLPDGLIRRVTGNSGGKFHPDMIAMPCADIDSAETQALPSTFLFFVRVARDGVPVTYLPPDSLSWSGFPVRFDTLRVSIKHGALTQGAAVREFMRSLRFPYNLASANVGLDDGRLSFDGLARFRRGIDPRWFWLQASVFRFGDQFALIGIVHEAPRRTRQPVPFDLKMNPETVRASMKELAR